MSEKCKWKEELRADWAYSRIFDIKIECMQGALNGKNYSFDSDDYMDYKYCPYCGKEIKLEEV